jgi:hypothetical protein
MTAAIVVPHKFILGQAVGYTLADNMRRPGSTS